MPPRCSMHSCKWLRGSVPETALCEGPWMPDFLGASTGQHAYMRHLRTRAKRLARPVLLLLMSYVLR